MSVAPLSGKVARRCCGLWPVLLIDDHPRKERPPAFFVRCSECGEGTPHVSSMMRAVELWDLGDRKPVIDDVSGRDKIIAAARLFAGAPDGC